jgi:dCMP deaminase
MARPKWDNIWMDFAHTISKRSYDPQFQVGTVIVSEDNCQVLAVGYNGNHKGGPNKRESEEPGHSGFIHAEINALIKLDYNNPKNKKMYLTLSPCRMCAKAIINGGIKKVFYGTAYRDMTGVELLLQNGVEVLQIVDN